jgi:hypothetical protein
VVKAARQSESGIGIALYVVLVVVLLGTGGFWYYEYHASKAPQTLELSPEAKQYVANLKLSDVGMKATESYVQQTIVEILGKISNTGSRPLDTVELYCLFYDGYGKLVSRQRVAIVSPRFGGLKPQQTKPFRLPFDDIPETWNRQVPQLVIAGMKFSQ